MSLLHSLLRMPAIALGAAALVAPFFVRREVVSISDAGTPAREHVFWRFGSASVHGPNRLVYDEISERFATRVDNALVEPPPLLVVRRVASLADNYEERFVVPYGAIDGGPPENGAGGLMRAYENDAFFYNRLCRYRE
jgi:hypothetical protein